MLFSVFNVVWVTTYLQAWKRYSSELAFRWGTLDQRDDLLAEPRPLFRVRIIIIYPAAIMIFFRSLFFIFIMLYIILTCRPD